MGFRERIGNHGQGNGKVLFYNKYDGSGMVGFQPRERSLDPGSFPTGCTQAISGWISETRGLFYNPDTGAGQLDFDHGVATPVAFKTGWTHIAAGSLDEPPRECYLFYKSETNAAAIGILENLTFRTLREFSFPVHLSIRPGNHVGGPWTHIIGLRSAFLALNAKNGSAMLLRWKEPDLEIIRTFKEGSFTGGWTLVIRCDEISAGNIWGN